LLSSKLYQMIWSSKRTLDRLMFNINQVQQQVQSNFVGDNDLTKRVNNQQSKYKVSNK